MIAPVACVLPAFNSASTLPAVAQQLRSTLSDATLIGVDDGSIDDTYRVASSVCDVVIHFDRNRGKGAALRAGFAHALSLPVAAVLTIDTDGQHDPARAPTLLGALAESDVAIGARARVGAMPFGRRITNSLASAAVSAVTGTTITDAQSGYRAIRAPVLEAVHAQGDRYEFETDFLIRAVRAGFRVTAVPIPTVYGPRSHFRGFRDSMRVIRTIWRYRAGVRS